MNLLRQQNSFRNSQRKTKILFIAAFCRFDLLCPFSTTPTTIHGNNSSSSPSSSSSLKSPVVSQSTSSEMADYLSHSCGLLSEEILSVCKRMASRRSKFKLENAVEAIGFLRGSGFTESQIRTVIRRRPQILAADVEETLKPKIIAFLHWGLSPAEVARFVSSNPKILHFSLEGYILPLVDVFRSFLLRNEDVIKCIKNFLFWPIFPKDVKERISTNLLSLRRRGVPETSLTKLLVTWPYVLFRTPSFVEEMVEKTCDLGLDLSAGQYPRALFILSSMKKSLWNSKLAVLKEFGWSEEYIAAAIRKSPLFLYLSPSKLKKKMQFFLYEVGCSAAEMSSYPVLLTLSLERRIIPRLAVIKLLDSRKLLSRKPRAATILIKTDEKFYEDYVLRHKDECPDILLAYKSSQHR